MTIMQIASVSMFLGGSLAAQLPDPAQVPCKLPRLESKAPRYALLAFGPKAERRSWIVLDGRTIYVDKNSNGDLTEPGDRIATPRIEKLKNHFVRESFTYNVGKLPATKGGRAYQRLEVSTSTWNLAYEPKGADMQKVMAFLRKNPTVRSLTIWLERRGKPKQLAMALFGTSRASAPVLHFDGPTSFGLVQNLQQRSFAAGAELDPLKVSLGTPGRGRQSFVYTCYSDLPKKARPTLEIVFPTSGEHKTQMVRVRLAERC